MERALREGRERAHRLDLVAEELDAQRLAAGRREDVDDAAAHGELAAVVDALDTLVARERERLGEPFDAELEPGAQLDRLGARVSRRQSLRERARRGADEPAALEHVERPRALADEVRRRREPGLPRTPRLGRSPTALVAEEPRRSLGGVARVRVLRQEHDEPALEPLVERGEQQRQRRLGDARARRQRVGELGEALVLDELADEGVKYRTVHDEGRNRGVPRDFDGNDSEAARNGVCVGADTTAASVTAAKRSRHLVEVAPDPLTSSF